MRLAMKALLAAALAASSLGAWAQSYPTRPVTLVVPFAAGGPTDVVARTLAAAMTKTMGQTVVVENKLGAGGTIAANYVAKATPDGYTVFIHHNGMATAPSLYRKLPFNPLTDFDYIGQVADVPMTLVARKDFPANNMRAFIAYVRANKDKMNPCQCGPGRRLALVRNAPAASARRGAHHRALPRDGAGDDSIARWQRGHPLRPDHTDDSADQVGEGEVLRGHDEASHPGAAGCADIGGAGTHGLRGRRLARHLRPQGNAAEVHN